MLWLKDILDERVSAFLLDEFLTFGAIAVATVFVLSRMRRMITSHTDKVITANIERPDRPFTVSFSPDAPGLRDAYRVDAWLRTVPVECLFFNPNTQRWQAQNFNFGVGTAFIDGALVTFRAVPTGTDDVFLAELQRSCDNRLIEPEFLDRLTAMDPNEVFSIVEACGLVRQFNQALEAIELPTDAARPVLSAFRVQGRALDLD